MIKSINTSKGCDQITRKIAVLGKQTVTEKKSVFSHTSDIIVGNIHEINHLSYKRADQGLNSVLQLLNQANISLDEMSKTLQEMQCIFASASSQNMSVLQLASLDSFFQAQIQILDQIATNSSYASISLLDGSSVNPLTINLPGGSTMDISIPDMRNSASPVSNPSDDDLQVGFPTTLANFDAAVPAPALGAPRIVLEQIKNFASKRSLLYVLADQIDKAFTAGLAALGNASATCVAYLQRVDWNKLLPPEKAAAAISLMGNAGFIADPIVAPGSTIDTQMTALEGGVQSEDEVLLATMQTAIPLLQAQYAQYVTQASPILSIASPDYFTVVRERLQSISNYIVSAQSSTCIQIQAIEGLRNIYTTYADTYGEAANRYLALDILDTSSQLATLADSYSFAISATTGFKSRLEQILADSYQKILRKASS